MAAPRKIFRIEETAVARHPGLGDGARAPVPHAPVHEARHAEVMQALGALRATLGAPRPRPAASAGSEGSVTTALQAAQLTRIVQELEAVAADTAQATQKILAAAEEIDQLANNLSAALKGKLEQGAAQDISDFVIRIFEACNFQDLSGQRIAKVRTTLNFLEHPSTPEANAGKSVPPRDDAAQLLHGPRLDGDRGHITQAEIDALFDS
jgi:chemotaxis regulatin CheY-phosphate phosphatase CheZ